jgi:hypothetical protein
MNFGATITSLAELSGPQTLLCRPA